MPDHIEYKGQFKDGIREGKGTLFFDTDKLGWKYKGFFSNGDFNGVGTLRDFDRETSKAYVKFDKQNFQNGRIEGEGQELYPSGKIRYKGNFSHNTYNGSGILYNEDGTVKFEGNFINGIPETVDKVRLNNRNSNPGSDKESETKLSPKTLEMLDHMKSLNSRKLCDPPDSFYAKVDLFMGKAYKIVVEGLKPAIIRDMDDKELIRIAGERSSKISTISGFNSISFEFSKQILLRIREIKKEEQLVEIYQNIPDECIKKHNRRKT